MGAERPLSVNLKHGGSENSHVNSARTLLPLVTGAQTQVGQGRGYPTAEYPQTKANECDYKALGLINPPLLSRGSKQGASNVNVHIFEKIALKTQDIKQPECPSKRNG